MFKIAILGCENSHADAFLESIINKKEYDDIEVVGVYSNEPEALDRMKEKFGVYCAQSFDEFVGKVDGIMITARDGDNHYKYAKPYISSGVHMFIDKPITSKIEDAKALITELKANGCRFTGGSTCPHAPVVVKLAADVKSGEYGKVYGGFLRAPVSMENAYGNFFFYAQHLIEVTLKIFGYFPTSVKTYTNKNVTTAILRYPDYDVSLEYVDGNYKYAATVSAEKGLFGGEYPVDGSLYPCELAAFHDILKGGAGKTSADEFIAPVYVINAFHKAITTGEEVVIERSHFD